MVIMQGRTRTVLQSRTTPRANTVRPCTNSNIPFTSYLFKVSLVPFFSKKGTPGRRKCRCYSGNVILFQCRIPCHYGIGAAQLGPRHVIFAQTAQPYAVAGRSLHHRGLAFGTGQRQQKMQPAVYAVQLHTRQRCPQGCSKGLHAAFIGKAHPRQVAGKIPAINSQRVCCSNRLTVLA